MAIYFAGKEAQRATAPRNNKSSKAKRLLAVALSPGRIARLVLAATRQLALSHPPRYMPRNRTGTGVKIMQLTVLVQSCFEAATVLHIRRDALTRRPLPSIGMQVGCKPKILVGEKLTRILTRRFLQRSLASVLGQLDHRTSHRFENPRGQDEKNVTSATPRSLIFKPRSTSTRQHQVT